MPFSRRSTSHLLIESQTLTILPWNDLDLGVTLTSFMTLTWDKWNQVKLMSRCQISIFHEMILTLTQRSCQDVPSHQKWSLYLNWFKSYSLNRQTHTHIMKTLPLPHTREVIMHIEHFMHYTCKDEIIVKTNFESIRVKHLKNPLQAQPRSFWSSFCLHWGFF